MGWFNVLALSKDKDAAIVRSYDRGNFSFYFIKRGYEVQNFEIKEERDYCIYCDLPRKSNYIGCYVSKLDGINLGKEYYNIDEKSCGIDKIYTNNVCFLTRDRTTALKMKNVKLIVKKLPDNLGSLFMSRWIRRELYDGNKKAD